MFSELSISAVPIVNEDGIVVNLYETVDVMVRALFRQPNSYSPGSFIFQTLVRSGSYQSLDLTISEALKQRSVDFPGVVICTASDSLGTLLQLIKKRRVHRLVVVEGEVKCPAIDGLDFYLYDVFRKKKRKEAEKAVCWVSSHSVTSCDISWVLAL